MDSPDHPPPTGSLQMGFPQWFKAGWDFTPVELRQEISKSLSLRELKWFEHWRDAAPMTRLELRARIKDMVKSWHLRVDVLMCVMRVTNTLWSGRAVLAIIDPGAWGSDGVEELEFYTSFAGVHQLIDFLRGEGYQYPEGEDFPLFPEGEGPEYAKKLGSDGISQVYKFVHKHYGSQVTVIQSSTPSPLVPILYQPSTVGMNVISALGVTCFYPGMTFKKRGYQNIHGEDVDEIIDQVVQGELARGYTILQSCRTEHDREATTGEISPACQDRTRTTDDGWDLSIAFEGDDFVPFLPAVRWRLGKPLERNEAGEVTKWKRAVVEMQERVGGPFFPAAGDAFLENQVGGGDLDDEATDEAEGSEGSEVSDPGEENEDEETT